MTCIIIEDQPPAQRILKKYIEDFGSLTLKRTFSNAIEALAFLRNESVDLIFLDIHLPKISGIDFLKTLPQPPQVILTTAFSDYALEGYELDVVDYLLKPFSFQRFIKAVTKATTKTIASSDLPSPTNSFPKDLFIKSGYEHIKVAVDEIIYIQSDADYTEIQLMNKKILTSEPLRYWLEKLDSIHFIQVHKSYIINRHKIEKIGGNQIYLPIDQVVPIGRAYKENFIKQVIK